MDIGEVVRSMKENPKRRFARKGWNGRDMYIQLQVPDEHSKMTLPYVYMRTAQGDLVPWLCSQTDLLSEDWVQIRNRHDNCNCTCGTDGRDDGLLPEMLLERLEKLLDEKRRFEIFYKAFHGAHEDWLAAHCFSSDPPEQDPFLQTIQLYYEHVFESECE